MYDARGCVRKTRALNKDIYERFHVLGEKKVTLMHTIEQNGYILKQERERERARKYFHVDRDCSF